LNLETNPPATPTQEYKEGILVGYRWHDTKSIEPQFAFGYGLSYTDFELGDINVNSENDSFTVTCTVENKGDINGSEVVQVYVGLMLTKGKSNLFQLLSITKI